MHYTHAKALFCGLVVVRQDDVRLRLLVLRQFNNWDFPLAEVNGDADPLRTAVDETRDVTGITDLTFPWGEAYRETLPFEDGQISRYYIARTETDEVLLRVPTGAGSDEDYEYRWVTVEEAEDVLPPRLAIVLDWVVAQLTSGAHPEEA